MVLNQLRPASLGKRELLYQVSLEQERWSLCNANTNPTGTCPGFASWSQLSPLPVGHAMLWNTSPTGILTYPRPSLNLCLCLCFPCWQGSPFSPHLVLNTCLHFLSLTQGILFPKEPSLTITLRSKSGNGTSQCFPEFAVHWPVNTLYSN